MKPETLRELVAQLAASAGALSALGAALQARTGGEAIAPLVRERLDQVLENLGVPAQSLADLSPAAARPVLGEIRSTLLHAVARLAPGGQPGWSHRDADTLQAAGDVSAGFPALLSRFLPQLPGLADRLATDGARFLDVGVGVAALSIEMARRWPGLRVVGIDVWSPALALAHESCRRAGLDGRIELREQAIQDLPDQAVFDLAWVPSGFIPGSVLPEGLRRVQRALRPGGWVLFASLDAGGDPLARSLSRLRAVEWGGHPWTLDQASSLLAEAGFTELAALPGPPGAVVGFVAGRAPPPP